MAKLSGAKVFVTDKFDENTFDPTKKDGMQLCGVIGTAQVTNDFDCKTELQGRYVIVLFDDNKEHSLAICEFRAYSDRSK